MARLCEMPVEVLRGPKGEPRGLRLGHRFLRVARRLERWRESGAWWEGEEEREVERLLLESGAVVEVSGPPHGHRWHLDTWWD
jgi:hypothetical protein